MVIDNYDIYLTDLFGVYMKLLPVEKRKSTHEFEILTWKEKEN